MKTNQNATPATITEAQCKDGIIHVGDVIFDACGRPVRVIEFYVPRGGSRAPELKAKLQYIEFNHATYQAVRRLSCAPAFAAAADVAPATKPEATLTQADFIAEARIYVSVKEYEAGLRDDMFGPAGPVLSVFDTLAAKAAALDAVVAALSDCVESLDRLPDAPMAFRVTCIAQAKSALSAAKSAQSGGGK